MATFKGSKVKGGSLNLRKTASTGATILVRIPDGTSLDVTDHDNTWLSTSYNGYNGYVMREFVDMSYASPRNVTDLFGSANLVYAPSTINKYVYNLQHFLNRWIPTVNEKIAVDGLFGPGTLQRVKDFQYIYDRDNKDGIVGPTTKSNLISRVAN